MAFGAPRRDVVAVLSVALVCGLVGGVFFDNAALEFVSWLLVSASVLGLLLANAGRIVAAVSGRRK